MKRQFRDVSGIFLLDKPQGLSSNQALQKVRWLFNARKAGHTGSLDPLATGLLPICLGEATKIAGHLLGSRKAYLAELRLGLTTNTDDADGQVVHTRPVPPLDDADIDAALVPLRGCIVQIPPVYSALKQGGVALYNRARRGEDVHAPPRQVQVYRLELIGREGDLLRLHVECGSGTYVRSLARDLGERLGCGAHLTALRRTWVEPFVEPQMVTLDALLGLQQEGDFTALDRLLLPLEEGLAALPALHLDAVQAQQLHHGQRLILPDAPVVPVCRALDGNDRLIALVEVRAGGEIAVRRGFNAPTP